MSYTLKSSSTGTARVPLRTPPRSCLGKRVAEQTPPRGNDKPGDERTAVVAPVSIPNEDKGMWHRLRSILGSRLPLVIAKRTRVGGDFEVKTRMGEDGVIEILDSDDEGDDDDGSAKDMFTALAVFLGQSLPPSPTLTSLPQFAVDWPSPFVL